ncbi:MAG: hypothetical protein OXI35_04285 [Gemmatimonadota bacterium]|nr:hypothetical protein [Gemmatimonadota bacterium]
MNTRSKPDTEGNRAATERDGAPWIQNTLNLVNERLDRMEERGKERFEEVRVRLVTVENKVTAIEKNLAVSFVNQKWFKWLIGLLIASVAGAAIKYIFS